MKDLYHNKPNVVKVDNTPIEIKVDTTPNPVYGAMGRKVTPTDTAEQQYRQALIPDRTINVEIDISRFFYNEPIPTVRLDLAQRSTEELFPGQRDMLAYLSRVGKDLVVEAEYRRLAKNAIKQRDSR